MTLPVYFIEPPLCGWYRNTDGTLHTPENRAQAALAVFDDRNALPPCPGKLLDELIEAAQKRGARALVLDFEHPPVPASCAFVKAAAARMRTAAPLALCAGTEAEPIVRYCPDKVLLADFVKSLPASCWLELQPVDITVCCPGPGTPPFPESADHYSAALGCHYRAKADADGLHLRLYDTKESFKTRFSLLAPRLGAAIGLRNELSAFDFTEDYLCKRI